MAALEESARPAGTVRLILETSRMLAPAQALYLSLGFSAIDNYGPYIGRADSVCMGKTL